jgi:hypothetical protein
MGVLLQLGHLSLKAILKSAAVSAGGQGVDYGVADVMARPLILAPRIA